MKLNKIWYKTMEISKYVFFFIFAGLMNGSFIVPVRFTKAIGPDKVWLYHSIIGIAFLPWVFATLLVPDFYLIYSNMDTRTIGLLLLGGFIFGIGQVCFSIAIDRIGIAISFFSNLAIGISTGSIFILLYNGVFFTTFGIYIILAIALIIIALFIDYQSSGSRFEKIRTYKFGWFLAVLAGCASGLQNIVFVVVLNNNQEIVGVNPFWIWPLFLLAASLPMSLVFFYRHRRNTSSHFQCDAMLKIKNLFLIVLMGGLFTGSLIMYSVGMSELDVKQQAVGWPLFMVSIILTSQFWGAVYKPAGIKKQQKPFITKYVSLFLLILAIFILSINSL